MSIPPIPVIDKCLTDFIENFFKDVAGFRYIEVGCKLEKDVLPTYEANKPANSISSITNDFYNCVEPKVGSAATVTAEKLGIIIVAFAILTAVFMILVVIIIISLNRKTQSGIIIAIVLFFALLYIVIGWLIIHSSFLTISNEITNIEQTSDRCVQNAINSTELFFTNQETAIDRALCAYRSTFCNPF